MQPEAVELALRSASRESDTSLDFVFVCVCVCVQRPRGGGPSVKAGAVGDEK